MIWQVWFCLCAFIALVLAQEHQQRANAQPRLCYDRVLNTGFGDRLSVYLTAAAAAATVLGEVYMFWEPQHSSACPSNVCELSFDRIQEYAIWPPNLKILPKEMYNESEISCRSIRYNIPGLLPSYYAYDGVYPLAWKTIMLPEPLRPLQLHNFVESYRQVAKQLKINIAKHPMLLDQKYVVVHVRGGDKSGPHSHFNTLDILRQLPHGMPIIVVTDSDDYLPLIIPNTTIPILTASTNISHPHSSEPSSLSIFRFPKAAERYEGIMQDFQLLLGATGIIQHSTGAWSSYSSVAAMAYGIPLLNTWVTGNPEDNSATYVGVLASFDSNGGVPAELKSAHREEDVRVFLDTMICEWNAHIAFKLKRCSWWCGAQPAE
jgi:hypothetical protein